MIKINKNGVIRGIFEIGVSTAIPAWWWASSCHSGRHRPWILWLVRTFSNPNTCASRLWLDQTFCNIAQPRRIYLQDFHGIGNLVKFNDKHFQPLLLSTTTAKIVLKLTSVGGDVGEEYGRVSRFSALLTLLDAVNQLQISVINRRALYVNVRSKSVCKSMDG